MTCQNHDDLISIILWLLCCTQLHTTISLAEKYCIADILWPPTLNCCHVNTQAIFSQSALACPASSLLITKYLQSLLICLDYCSSQTSHGHHIWSVLLPSLHTNKQSLDDLLKCLLLSCSHSTSYIRCLYQVLDTLMICCHSCLASVLQELQHSAYLLEDVTSAIFLDISDRSVGFCFGKCFIYVSECYFLCH